MFEVKASPIWKKDSEIWHVIISKRASLPQGMLPSVARQLADEVRTQGLDEFADALIEAASKAESKNARISSRGKAGPSFV